MNSWIREVLNSETCEFVILRTRAEVMKKRNQLFLLAHSITFDPWKREKRIREFGNLWIRNFENSWGGYDKKEPIILANWKNCINFTKMYCAMCGSPNSTTSSTWYKFLTLIEFFKQLMVKSLGFEAIKGNPTHKFNFFHSYISRFFTHHYRNWPTTL